MFNIAELPMNGHLTVRDKITGEVLVSKSNAIHYGNMSAAIVRALSGDDSGHIRYMAFGNGGASIQTDGTVLYAEPNVSEVYDEQAALYNETYQKDVQNSGPDSYVETVNGANADLRVVVTLASGEPNSEQVDEDGNAYGNQLDLDDLTDFNNEYVFNELALKDSRGIMLSHVRFHPVLKSANRILEIEYTIRVQMS